MVIRVYWASVTGNRKIAGDQTRLRYIIESLNIPSEWIDITTDSLIKDKMREECGNPKAMPPQIFNEFRYLGDVADMEEHIEQESLREWFGIDDVSGSTSDSSSSDGDKNETGNGTNNVATSRDDVAISNVTTEDGRQQSSPTSSIENAPPAARTSNKTENMINGISDVPPPSRKNVIAAAGAFEDLGKQNFTNKPQVIFTKSKSLNTNACENTKEVDEERKRRILGLSTTTNTNASVTIGSIKKPSSDGPERNIKKLSISSER